MPRSAMHQMKNDENVQNWDYKVLICTQVMMVRILPVESSQQIIVIPALCNWEIQKMNNSIHYQPIYNSQVGCWFMYQGFNCNFLYSQRGSKQ